MVDRLSVERRSWLMSRVSATDTSPEVRVRKVAHRMGLRFRLHRRTLPGKPDLIFPRYRVALFVHGCFWHRHPGCKKASTPKSRVDFWLQKFEANVRRDKIVRSDLESLGWHVVIIWECQTKELSEVEDVLSREVLKWGVCRERGTSRPRSSTERPKRVS